MPCAKHLAQSLALHRSSGGGGHFQCIYWSTVETRRQKVTIKPLPQASHQRTGAPRLVSGCAWKLLGQGLLHSDTEMPLNYRGWHWARHFSAFYKGGLGSCEFFRFAGLSSAKIQIPCYSSSFGLSHTFSTKAFTLLQHLLISCGQDLLPLLPEGQELDVYTSSFLT